MIAAGKTLAGAIAIVVPVTAVATTTKFLKSKVSGEESSQDIQVEAPKDCYLITVTPANEGKSFLVCNNSEFYFHTKEHTNPYKKVKSLKVQDPNNIVIVLEENSETKNLTGNGEEWKDLTKNVEFFNQRERSCVVSSADGSWTGTTGDKVLSCTETSPYQAFKAIQLKTFTE